MPDHQVARDLIKGKWVIAENFTHGDFVVLSTHIEGTIMQEKDEKTLGAKTVPIVIGRGGDMIDAAAEIENMMRVDPVVDRDATAALRNPMTGQPLRTHGG